MALKKIDLPGFIAFLSLLLLFAVVVIHLHFVILPLFFLTLGLLSYIWNGKKALVLFLFLLPLIHSTPDLFFNGYPFNYMGISLFYLSGILGAAHIKKDKLASVFPARGLYLLFLSLLAISVFFVFLRWSNLGLPSRAFLCDTPVAPSLERVSFACIFPVITLALFSLTPFLASLLRFWQVKEIEIFTPLKSGFCLSFLLALIQKWVDPDFLAQSWWGLKMNQVNGGFSDFNAFGFFAGAMFLYQALKLFEKFPLKHEGAVKDKQETGSMIWRVWGSKTFLTDVIFLAVALAAIFISGCRTAFLFVLAAMIPLFFTKKVSLLFKAAVISLLGLSLLIAGGTLGRRLWRTAAQAVQLSSSADLFQKTNRISSGRLDMLRDSARMVGRFPVSGVGAGNFLFYLKYLRFGEKAYLDLPLNQYLLFFSETGLAGGLAFLFFLAALFWRQKSGTVRFILAVMAIALFFNNFFWFPEVLLLFWVFVARAEWTEVPAFKKGIAWGAAVVLLFVVMNIIDFQALHPQNWARERSVSYDYGLWNREREGGREFRWTGEKSGFYVRFDPAGRSPDYSLSCGAPLARLPERKQTVDVFWRGKLLRRVVFVGNAVHPFHVEDRDFRGGFLEFRVRPVFNLKRMGLGKEMRTLGVQVSGAGI